MANVIGTVDHPENPEWGALQYDDGSQSSWVKDPDGSYRAAARDTAAKLQGQPGASGLGNDASDLAHIRSRLGAVTAAGGAPTVDNFPGSNATPTPEAILAIGPPAISTPPPPNPLAGLSARDAAALKGPAMGAGPVANVVQRPDALGKPAAAGGPAPAASSPAPAPMAPPLAQPTTSTTTESTRTTSGIEAGDRKRIDAAFDKAQASQKTADDDAVQAHNERLIAQWDRLTENEKQARASQAVQAEEAARFDARVQDQVQKNTAIAERHIDPSEAFKGDRGFYAFMAAIGDGLQNFGAMLAGHGPVANPAKTINDMIEREVGLQTEQRALEFKQGQITAEELKAEREHARMKLAAVGVQLAKIQEDKATNQDEKKAAAAMGSALVATRDKASVEQATAVARHEQNSRTQKTTPVAPTADLFNGEKPDWNSVEAHSQRQAGADQVERGVSRFEKAAGITWDERANNGAGGYVGPDGKVVTADDIDVPGASTFGETPKWLAGEKGREVQGALDDMAAGGAKVKDPVGAVSDKSVDSEKSAMAATTDAGALRAAERTRRNLRGMRAGIDSAYSPGVINASRIRRTQETHYQNNRPGLPKTRTPTAEDL